MLTFGSLFSGIGGMDLGLERAGWECKWQVEIDPWCQKVLAKNWPDVPRYGDVKEADDLAAVDLICGGFPCQPVSLAGKRLAQSDDRWLWPEFARVVRLVGPRFIIVENVPGLLVRGMDDVLRDLALMGFDAEWGVLPASAFGAPHLRARVFLVAYSQRARGDGIHERVEAGHMASDLGISGANESNWTTPIYQGRRPVFYGTPGASDWWTDEPRVGRVVDGVPPQVDRLRGLGNAVVPQVAEWIGRRLLDVA